MLISPIMLNVYYVTKISDTPFRAENMNIKL